MTPKEKAFQLINKYNLVVLDTALGGSNRRVKQCAIIAVDELIESHLILTTTHEAGSSIRCKTYCQQVKEEINKL